MSARGGDRRAHASRERTQAPLPRLTGAVFHDLAIWMTGLGLTTGLVFPPVIVLLGMPAERALTARFFAECVAAWMIVGAANFALARVVVGRRLKALSGRMRLVAARIHGATEAGDWSDCGADGCLLEVDSRDELGESALAFNTLVEALERSRGVETAVRELLEGLTEHIEPQPLAEAALERLLAHIGEEVGAIVLGGAGEPELLAHAGLPAAEALAAFVAPAAASGRAAGLAVRPIQFNDQLLGALLVRRDRTRAGDARRLVGLFVRAFGVALNNALAHQRLHEQARRDSLTGLLGPRAFDETLHELIVERRRFALLMVDVDDFKLINDTYGHPAGDETLRRVAEAVRRSVRDGDVAFRVGGDELCVLLPDASTDAAVAVAERLRETVRRITDGRPATLSIGVASCPEHGSDRTTVVASADAALYRSKQAGKDRISAPADRCAPAVPPAPLAAPASAPRI